MRKLTSLFALTTFAIFGAACGSDDDNGVVIPDAAPQPDASTIDAAPAACMIEDFSGGFQPITDRTMVLAQRSVDMTVTPPQVDITIGFNVPPMGGGDAIIFRAFEGAGPFMPNYPIVDTVVPITGEEADLATCNLCLFFQADIVGNTATSILMARSGSATIRIVDNVEAGGLSEFDLDLTDVVFNEIDLNTGADLPGGCTTTVGSFMLEAGIEAADTTRQPAPRGDATQRLPLSGFTRVK